MSNDAIRNFELARARLSYAAAVLRTIELDGLARVHEHLASPQALVDGISFATQLSAEDCLTVIQAARAFREASPLDDETLAFVEANIPAQLRPVNSKPGDGLVDEDFGCPGGSERRVDSAIAQLDEQAGPSKTPKDWRKLETMSAGELFRGLAKDARGDALHLLTHLWSELAAINLIWADLASEFEGIDPVLRGVREQAQEVRARIDAVADALKVRKRPAADPEHVEQYRPWIDNGLEQLGHTRQHR